VYLSEDDLRRAAAFLGMEPGDFERRYVYRTSHKLRLRVAAEARCPFLESHGCAIHPAKPTQCRIFPFWPELVNARREWKKAARFCPGIDNGPLIQIETAQAQAEEMRTAYPHDYRNAVSIGRGRP
jgi:Fe-S-cluster containining protein